LQLGKLAVFQQNLAQLILQRFLALHRYVRDPSRSFLFSLLDLSLYNAVNFKPILTRLTGQVNPENTLNVVIHLKELVFRGEGGRTRKIEEIFKEM